VGLIEEGAKLLALYFIARRLPSHTVRDGVVLGAAVGFGFAALESSGYALTALIVLQGSHVYFSLGNVVFTELLRGVLSPIGHGLWTGIVGGVMFAASRGGRLRLRSWSVLVAYLAVSLLHALYDAMGAIALLLTAVVTGSSPTQLSSNYVALDTVLQVAGIAVISALGLVWLWRLWRRRRNPDEPAPAAAAGPAG
jgi:RsiW-degrading membrane proteinase PrsW (M82 family)